MVADLSLDERFLNLVMINMGEALYEYANLRQRGAVPSDPDRPFAPVQLKLRNAIAALSGEAYVAPVDPQHIHSSKKGINTIEKPSADKEVSAVTKAAPLSPALPDDFDANWSPEQKWRYCMEKMFNAVVDEKGLVIKRKDDVAPVNPQHISSKGK